ncbi:Cyclopropane-fatty-acyl-phospholipid synthase [Rhodococcus sp. RD6.2]|uniref:class I SAM-dependent methyltransferase n=1 Tax=Rhodococcus sp. RD6.2 TaxID=260936 RepID=UPI00063BB2BD|nr:class I SAM-dependent methyltransferase [Rhodococcus sp. RD6.2]CRK51158.1 Cyclopropane-fatty-acyl-phospholipid synthase [Rhodococcus sp. RD6.2]
MTVTHVHSIDTAPDPVRWPDIARVPSGVTARFGAPIAARLFRRAASRLDVRVALPDGTNLGSGDPRAPLMRVHRPAAFARRVAADGLIGFGEAYMAGDWDAPDPAAVLTPFAASAATLVPRALQVLRPLVLPGQPAAERNSAANTRSNISRHYDLSNELFALFLDDTMTYSSALFGEVPARWDALEAAQHRKIDRLLDEAGVGAGTRLLEIGTGWGELAVRAAQRGAHVRSVTLSSEQQELARRRVAAAGFADRVRIDLLDYRGVRGEYDAVVSVEMIEAVGFEYWPTYFETIDRVLVPGGRVALQAITMPDARMRATRGTYTWIHKYIFPGGLLPSTEALEQAAAHTALRTEGRLGFGSDYADTLRLWRERFTANADAVAGLGFDATFRRMWEFYLAYSEAGFRSGYLDVQQITLTKGGAS